ncbi:hypothetical protein JCM11641_005184 [Rhodosporidiobolus odoratus]
MPPTTDRPTSPSITSSTLSEARSPSIDGGPPSSTVPSSQGAPRPGTQDALRGQGNSAATEGRLSMSKEEIPSAQGKKAAFSQEVEEGGVVERGGQEDFRTTEVKRGEEPAPGKVNGSPDNEKNLVEAGTTMAGAADPDRGLLLVPMLLAGTESVP